MIAALLFGLALEPPAFPEVEPVEGECPFAVEVDPEIQGCRGLLLPTSYAAELLAWKKYGEGLAELYKVDTSVLLMRIEALEEPPKWHERPAVRRWLGRAEGVVLGAAIGALAVYAIDR